MPLLLRPSMSFHEVPGVGLRTAEDVLAEIGIDMSRFPTVKGKPLDGPKRPVCTGEHFGRVWGGWPAVLRDRLAPDARLALDPPKRPTEGEQSDNSLSLHHFQVVGQDSSVGVNPRACPKSPTRGGRFLGVPQWPGLVLGDTPRTRASRDRSL